MASFPHNARDMSVPNEPRAEFGNRPRGAPSNRDTEQPAGARRPATDFGWPSSGNPHQIPTARGAVPQRPQSAGFLLQGGARHGQRGTTPAAQSRVTKYKTAVKPPAAKPARSNSYSSEVPPLATALDRAGLGHYTRKLCDEMSCSTVQQLLRLERPQVDALLDALRPLPGHRVRLHTFLADQRMEAMKAAADGAAAEETTFKASAAQRREWKVTMKQLNDAALAAKRGRDGPIAHLIEQQPTNWGASKGPPAMAQAYVCRTRVIKVGNGRMTVYDGPSPNSPKRMGSTKGNLTGPASVYDPDEF